MDTIYNINTIRDSSVFLLKQKGMPEEDASILVDSMISADLCGVSTHGIRMLPAYIDKIERREVTFEPIRILKQLPAFTIIDANNTIGAVSASKAVEIAVAEAKETGVHTVFAHNANTFGPGFYYAERIASHNMIGFVCCNAPAAMPAYNGLEAMLGTNPIAFAAPTKSGESISIDFATSIVAKSKFATAKANGQKLEPGWAIDKEGKPTIDPDEGIKGLVLPMAGFKGYAIAMIIDILAGLLSGASYLKHVGKFYSKTGECMNVGHMVVAFNPDIVFEGNYSDEIEKYIRTLRNSKAIPGKSIIIPGDKRSRKRKESLYNGISISSETRMRIEKLFEDNLGSYDIWLKKHR